jgi:hypothetical protein
VSAAQEAGWSCTEQGSGGVVPQLQGAQAVFAGQAGQPHTDAGADPPSVLADGDAVLERATVIVVAEPLVHEQLQAGQVTPAGQTGQLQVQVPDPLPVPVPPPAPVIVPHPPPVPSVPPPPPQLQSQGGQYSPGAHTGQAQVQVPPPPLPTPPSAAGGGGQSH